MQINAVWLTRGLAQILTNTTNKFWKPDFQSLLSNGTVNNPANPPNNDTGIVYGTRTPFLLTSPKLKRRTTGDYYFITAGNELVKQGLATCNGSSTSNSSSTGSGSGASSTGSAYAGSKRSTIHFGRD